MHLNEAINRFRSFLTAWTIGDVSFNDTEDVTVFTTGVGIVSISGVEFDRYRECLDALAEAVATRDVYNKNGVEEKVKEAVAIAWQDNHENGKPLEEIVKAAIGTLRKELDAQPKQYLVYVPILGIELSTLPARLGKITFLPGDSRGSGKGDILLFN